MSASCFSVGENQAGLRSAPRRGGVGCWLKSSLLFVVHCPLGLVACLGLENIWLSVGKCSGHLVMPDGVIWLRTRRSLKPSLLVNLCLGELHPFQEEEEEEVERWLSGCGREE